MPPQGHRHYRPTAPSAVSREGREQDTSRAHDSVTTPETMSTSETLLRWSCPERALAADRYRTIVDVYVLLRRPDGMILLLERSGTGYADGQLCPPSGYLEAGESVVQGAIREAREETGVLIDPADLGRGLNLRGRKGAQMAVLARMADRKEA